MNATDKDKKREADRAAIGNALATLGTLRSGIGGVRNVLESLPDSHRADVIAMCLAASMNTLLEATQHFAAMAREMK